MKHKLIKTENYLLIVDDSEIKKGDWCLDLGTNKMFKAGLSVGNEYKELFKKIIAHLPLNGATVLEGVDLLPPLEDEVEKLADEIYPETYYSGLYVDGWLKAGFIKGYNKAKEKYKYTDEDLIGVFNFLSFSKKSYSEFKDFIQSLQQPKMPVGFECEWNTEQMPEFHQAEPKTTTNSQGQTVWVGKYIY